MVTIPPELVPVLGITEEVTHEEFVDGIPSVRMCEDIPFSWTVY